MERKFVGFFARLMDSSKFCLCAFHYTKCQPSIFHIVPVARAADLAESGTGRIWLSSDDPCLVFGEGTRFLTELSPRMQILLPKSVNSAIAEVTEVQIGRAHV